MKRLVLDNGSVFVLIGSMLLAGLPLRTDAASAGALDPTFSADGKLTTNITGDDEPRDAMIQPDGKIIVVGRVEPAGDGVGDFFVVRYNPSGSLDTTFDSDGIVTTNFGNSESASAVALQPDGKIVVVGASTAGDNDFAVARYRPDGSLDPTFSGDGRVTTDFGGGSNDNAWGVVIQADGRILVGGFTSTGGDQNFGMVRYNLDGTLDVNFGGDGIASYDTGGVNNGAWDIKLQSDGRIVAAGGNTTDFVIYRLTTSGFLDATFDTDGIVTTNFSGNDYAYSLEIQPDGRIVAAGRSDSGQNSAIARYNTNGSLDNSFDGDGRLTVNFNSALSERIEDIKLSGDGKILAAVRTTGGNFLGVNAARINSNGSLDHSFGNGGVVTTSSPQGVTNTEAVALSGGELLVVGDGDDISVTRFNLNIKPTQTNDFDGDGYSDYVIFRPSTATWYILQSFDSTTQIAGFGSNGDVPLDGDFDGDGRNDLAIYRPGVGEWWFLRSSANTVFAAQFGAPGDKPVPGDVDKDGKTDVVFWRPANGNYFVLRSSDNFTTYFGFPFGANGDIPVGTANP